MEEVIYKYFRDEPTMHYNTADLIQDEHYLRFEKVGSEKVIISVGCNNGEVPLKVCKTAQELEEIIKNIIY